MTCVEGDGKVHDEHGSRVMTDGLYCIDAMKTYIAIALLPVRTVKQHLISFKYVNSLQQNPDNLLCRSIRCT